MLQENTFSYAVKMRRELHQVPEIGFDLPKTCAIVRRELEAMGIPYTQEFCESSFVAVINPECKGFTIGIRADMDALPIEEANDVPYRSQHPGQMHACGHDAHTAMLLAVARELKARENELACRVKLLFTPAEEYIKTGCEKMTRNGVMDDIDCTIACHVTPGVPVGQIQTRVGGGNANSMTITMEFFGKGSHAASQQKGRDAIAMAVEAYTAMEIMVAKEIAPTEPRMFNIGSFHGGHTNNIICDYCKLFATTRTHSDQVTDYMLTRITQICEGIARANGGEAKVTVDKFNPYVLNNQVMVEKLNASAAKIIGEQNVGLKNRSLGGEDYAWFSRSKPGIQFNLGITGDDPSKTGVVLHNERFDLDERSLEVGVKIFCQFVLDNQHGIKF